MKISLEWLSSLVEWRETDPQAIAERLTLCTAEVESVEQQGVLLDRCCVGRVTQVEKHPKADRLQIATVQTDQGDKTVVCGGTNVRPDMLVAFAHVGATVRWHGEELHTLEPATIRGISSEGMICASEELELDICPALPEDGERPIMDLSRAGMNAEQVGRPLREALGLTDTILDISNTAITMRPDLFSHRGIARECVALGLASWRSDAVDVSLPSIEASEMPIALHVQDPSLLQRYRACTLQVDALGESPEWMQRRLKAVGVRCLNAPIDITNYVAWEIGVPLHSFDAAEIRGDLHLRLSDDGEVITTLDKQERRLPAGALVMSDDDGLVDLVGIMGGLRSSTTSATRQIYLHAASIDPVTMRQSILRTGHRTDAATVYEKGVPPIVTEEGFARALRLFLELVPGARITSAVMDWGETLRPSPIVVPGNAVRATLGMSLDDEQMADTLRALECTVEQKGDTDMLVTPPAHRVRDLTGLHDIVEEVGRILGYDRIPEDMPTAALRIPQRDNRTHRLRRALAERGYNEVVPLSFMGESLLTACGLDADSAVRVQNPLGEETAVLRPYIFPQLLQHAGRSMSQVQDALCTFAMGHMFTRGQPEVTHCALLHAAKHEAGLLDHPFLRVKQAALRAVESLGYEVTVRAAPSQFGCAQPGLAAEIVCADQVIGVVFGVESAVAERFDLSHGAAIALLYMDTIHAMPHVVRRAQPIPSLPSVQYDETILRSHAEPLAPELRALERATPLLERAVLQDVYDADTAPGTYRATIRFTYRAADRTLTEAEAKEAHAAVLAQLASSAT